MSDPFCSIWSNESGTQGIKVEVPEKAKFWLVKREAQLLAQELAYALERLDEDAREYARDARQKAREKRNG